MSTVNLDTSFVTYCFFGHFFCHILFSPIIYSSREVGLLYIIIGLLPYCVHLSTNMDTATVFAYQYTHFRNYPPCSVLILMYMFYPIRGDPGSFGCCQ